MRRACALARRVPSATRRRRTTGSDTDVPRDTSMAESRLPASGSSAPASGPSSRTDRGTMATRESPSGSPRSARSCRSAPPTTLRTTSLTVPPNARRTAVTSSIGTWVKAKARCDESGPLIELSGAENGGGGGRRPSSSRSRRLWRTRARTVAVDRSSVSATVSGSRIRAEAAPKRRSCSRGNRSPTHSSLSGPPGSGSAVPSRKAAMISVPSNPSATAWWSLATTI